MVLYNPKLKTLFTRDDKFKVTDQFTDPRFEQVGKWLVTEKMDGTSVILSIHQGAPEGPVSFHGRTSKSQFTPAMTQFLESTLNEMLFSLADHGIYQADIYAELVGPGVQGNPHGPDELTLFVFDVRIGNYWLDWDNVEDVADKAGLRTVRVANQFGTSTHEIVWAVKWNYFKELRPVANTFYVEGVVARTDPLLYDNQGSRIMWKLKVSDFA